MLFFDQHDYTTSEIQVQDPQSSQLCNIVNFISLDNLILKNYYITSMDSSYRYVLHFLRAHVTTIRNNIFYSFQNDYTTSEVQEQDQQ